MNSTILDRGLSEAEVRAAMTMRERAAHICDQMGDRELEKRAKVANIGIGILSQRFFMQCSAAIRDLPLNAEGPKESAGTAVCDSLQDLVDGLQDMRRRKVINEARDGKWLTAALTGAIHALQLMGRI